VPITGEATIAQLVSTTTAESATISKTSLPILPSFPKNHATKMIAYLYRRRNATASKKFNSNKKYWALNEMERKSFRQHPENLDR
jgi:hypothetical protein